MGASLSYPTVDLSGKVAIITGGNTGIGYETAKALAAMGAHTIIACRSEERATAAIERIKEELVREDPVKQVVLEYMQLDLSSFQSTKAFISAFKERNLSLNILINNAGIAWVPLTRTADGYESQLQINHLSHFLLTLELLPVILETASATGDCRIIFVSSLAHTWVDWDPANMNADQSYSRRTFYPYSKLYNVMTTYALQRRLQDVGVTVSALHPGTVDTEVVRGFSDVSVLKFGAWLSKPFLRNAKDGAATSINCAVNPELNSRQALYYENCRPKESSEASSRLEQGQKFRGEGQRSTKHDGLGTLPSESSNEQSQEELWRITVDIVKDYLSPDVLEKYGPSQPVVQSEVVEGDDEGRSEPASSDIASEAVGKEETEGERDKETEAGQTDSN